MKKISPSGPANSPRIAIVGEFPVDADTQSNEPFASAGGWHLKNWLAQVGIPFEDCYRTYLFKSTPPGNDLRYWCATKKECLDEARTLSGNPKEKYLLPVFATPSKFIRPSFGIPALAEIKAEIEAVRPNVVIALGRANSWAFLGNHALDNTRGRVAESTLIPGQKVVATYGPISVLRAYDLLPIFLADLSKGLRESAFAGVRIPPREIWINPTLTDCWEFYNRYIALGSGVLSVDIESEREQVTCIGFAPDRYHSLVVPFWNKSNPNWSYWPSLHEEQLAWAFVRNVVTGPNARPALYQNGLYDMQFTLRTQGISMTNPAEDSMLLHHALQPEMEKGLGFLASLHTDAPAWKGMFREAKAKENQKADD